MMWHQINLKNVTSIQIRFVQQDSEEKNVHPQHTHPTSPTTAATLATLSPAPCSKCLASISLAVSCRFLTAAALKVLNSGSRQLLTLHSAGNRQPAVADKTLPCSNKNTWHFSIPPHQFLMVTQLKPPFTVTQTPV